MPTLKLVSAVLFVGAASVYGLTTLSASIPRWTILYLWAALACVVFLISLWKSNGLGVDLIDGLALTVLLWAGLSLLWSSDWRQGVLELTNCATLCAVFLWIRRVPDWIPAAALLSVVIALVLQYLFPEDWGGHGNRNFQTEAMILLACLAFNQRKKILLVVWFLIVPLLGWYLVFDNPSKIEFLIVPAILAWQLYERRDLFKFRARPIRAVV